MRLDPVRLDVLVASVLFIGAELQVFLGGAAGADRALSAVAAGVVTASVAVRRRYPWAVGIVVQAVLVVSVQVIHLPAGPVSIAWFCALYAMAVWTTLPWFIAGTVFFAASDLLPQLFDSRDAQTVVPFTLGAIVVMLLLRRIVGDREQRLRIAERERDLAAREAVVEERARIARELHDVIAHHVSMMVVQAGAERRVLGADTAAKDSTADVLQLIERIGRDALTEMRRLVGMLRNDQDDGLEPQPGIEDIPTLVAKMREAGLPVELRIDGDRRQLPVGIGLSAYRIVQEGLTNALKHSGCGPTSVHIGYGPSMLELEIADRGTGVRTPITGGGHGLVGIRERVALYGGAFDAAHRPDGGFAIRALLPVR